MLKQMQVQERKIQELECKLLRAETDMGTIQKEDAEMNEQKIESVA